MSLAGSTAERLKSLGADVAVPGDPPLGPDATGKIEGDPVGPLDGGNDTPPYQIDTTATDRNKAVTAPSTKPAKSQNSQVQNPPNTPPPPKGLASNTGAPKSLETAENASACLAELVEIADAEVAPPPDADIEACVIETPVILKATKGKDVVKFPPGLLLDCGFARYLAEFTADVVQPLARYHLGKSIRQIQSGQGFVCRRRNNAKEGKLSEHSFGNATDWVGFKFDDGQQLGINAEELEKPSQAEFLNAIRAAGCGYFTTVLGPGSDAAHATHFHFDRGRTNGKKNPHRICE